jgi:stringent starvation protein B
MKILPFTNVEKQAQMLHLLKMGTVMVFTDARRSGVMVPDKHTGDFQLRLNFDYAFEIGDFKVLPDGLEATLSFNQIDAFCRIPFSAVYLMICHESQVGALFPESIPKEMMDFFSVETRAGKVGPSAPIPVAPALAVAKAVKKVTKESDDVEPVKSEEVKPKKKNHLRVVK